MFAAAVSVNASLLLQAIMATLLGLPDGAPVLAALTTAGDAAGDAVASVGIFALVRHLVRRRGLVFWLTAGVALAIALVGPVVARSVMTAQPLALDPATVATLVATRAVAAGITAAMLVTLGQTTREPRYTRSALVGGA